MLGENHPDLLISLMYLAYDQNLAFDESAEHYSKCLDKYKLNNTKKGFVQLSVPNKITNRRFQDLRVAKYLLSILFCIIQTCVNKLFDESTTMIVMMMMIMYR